MTFHLLYLDIDKKGFLKYSRGTIERPAYATPPSDETLQLNDGTLRHIIFYETLEDLVDDLGAILEEYQNRQVGGENRISFSDVCLN